MTWNERYASGCIRCFEHSTKGTIITVCASNQGWNFIINSKTKSIHKTDAEATSEAIKYMEDNP